MWDGRGIDRDAGHQSQSPQPADFAQRIDWGIVNVVEVVEAANLAESTA